MQPHEKLSILFPTLATGRRKMPKNVDTRERGHFVREKVIVPLHPLPYLLKREKTFVTNEIRANRPLLIYL